jgi:hypothetical protein
MGISASHYLAPYVYRRHRSGRHQLLTPTADPKTFKVVVLQGSAMGYPTKRDLCAAIVRSYWSFTSSMELDARRVPTQIRKALLRAAHVEIRRLERLERMAKRTRCPVALRRPGFRYALERALRSHRELAEGLKAVMKWAPCPENIRPAAPPARE